MCAVAGRPNERAMHETFLVVKAAPGDVGTRPLTGPYASPEITVGPDGRPRAVVWNLGTREVHGVVTEFAAIPAGLPVSPDHKRIIGLGNPANIGPNNSVTVTCNSIWPGKNSGEVLLVAVFHPELDPVRAPCDPLHDRHIGQMNYPWAGTFEGVLGTGAAAARTSVQIRPANQGCFKVRIFQAINGRLPSNPQVDRMMAPTGAVFRWIQPYAARKEDWELTMLENNRMQVRMKIRSSDGKADQEIKGALNRI